VLAFAPEKESTLPPPPELEGLLSVGASSRGMYSARMLRTEGKEERRGEGRMRPETDLEGKAGKSRISGPH